MNTNELTANGSARITYQPVGSIAEPREDFRKTEEPAAPGQRRRSFKRFAWAAVAVLVVLGVSKAVLDWWSVHRWVEATDDAYVGGDVTVIAPKVSALIAKVFVADNQTVRAGDLLVKLDERDYLAALAKTDAAISLQKAALNNADAMRRLQESLIAQAQAVIVAADAEVLRSGDDQVRAAQLLKEGALSLQDSQRADAAFKTAVAVGDRARAGLVAAQQQLAVIDTQKEQIRAALAQADAERELARLNLSYTEVKAPIDGIIGNRSGRAGAYAAIGSQLISLVPSHGLWIDANFKESQLAGIKPGCEATIEVDSIPGKTFRAHVQSIAPATGAQFSLLPPENATGNFTKIVQRVAVRIVLDDDSAAAGQLRPGLSVTARVNTNPKSASHE